MYANQLSRRRFFKQGAALAGLAAGAMTPAASRAQTLATDARGVQSKDARNIYGERSRFETWGREREDLDWRDIWLTPLEDLQGIITPSSVHFLNHHYGIPDIDPRGHRLLIHGLVEHPLILTMDELKRLPSVSRIHTVECVANIGKSVLKDSKTAGHTHGNLGCSEWTGVPLSLLLQEVGLKKNASWVVAESADGGKRVRCIPLEKAMDDVLLVYAQNGEAVRPDQGYPLRFLVPGWEGNINVKWLRRIKVVDQPYLARAPRSEKGHWEWEQPVRSVITYPSGGQQLAGRGYCQISGFAWSGGGAIHRLEVSTDGGRSWKDAQLQEPVLRRALTRFRMDWNWDGQETVLQSRATDDLGNVQPSLAEFSKGQGVNVDHWRSNELPTHVNPIHSWKITQEGSIQNAFA